MIIKTIFSDFEGMNQGPGVIEPRYRTKEKLNAMLELYFYNNEVNHY